MNEQRADDDACTHRILKIVFYYNNADVPYVHDSCNSRDGVSEIFMIYLVGANF